ncbi:MAG TPA: hypothetical protein VEC39_16815 [Vicinamibacterales bacterium]|nr:hypothetical protein [Vicinamibacterales bacterium]
MIAVATNALLVLAACSLGLRATSVLIPGINRWGRLVVSVVIGLAVVVATLQACASYELYDLGLGLLVSLSPVGVFDLVKWWFRR